MNERIRELAEQAMVETQHEFGGKYLAFSKEKFAELIVRECAGLVRGHPHFDKMLDCATVIEQHFGVES